MVVINNYIDISNVYMIYIDTDLQRWLESNNFPAMSDINIIHHTVVSVILENGN